MPVSLMHPDRFVSRHIGPRGDEIASMLRVVGAPSLEVLISETVPEVIRRSTPLALPPARSEHRLLEDLAALAGKNHLKRSLLGTGYSDTITPGVILRNIVQNPGWYTQYTPYQAEISQGRLEALLNFQTLVSELTALEVSNASLLDEATAAAEAMHLMHAFRADATHTSLFVSEGCHPQTVEVVRTRAEALGIVVVVGDHRTLRAFEGFFGAILQYPTTDGRVDDYRLFIEETHRAGGLVTLCTDLLALCLLTPPGALGADVAVGNSQRFGVPLGYGGPHAAFFATRTDFVRRLPGRIIGVSVDSQGQPALRMALQTREQHIRREKATSNVCTAQALLAVVASMYAVYHGPAGLRQIAERTHGFAVVLSEALSRLGLTLPHRVIFDTVRVDSDEETVTRWMQGALAAGFNLRRLSGTSLTVSLDEPTTPSEIDSLISVFADGARVDFTCESLARELSPRITGAHLRSEEYLKHPVFNRYHSETEMLRYVRALESRDLSLTHSMIPLGSCTMKLNATAEMIPITWPAFNRVHPFAPTSQTQGYQVIFQQLERALSEITGFPGISLQPNAGSQGEYAGLLVIKKYHQSRGDSRRTVCLIPSSAHGTNPASAVMAGFEVVVVACDKSGNVDLSDLAAKAYAHRDVLGVLMVTYPSTHGVFEEDIMGITEIAHAHGAQVYMDGANMNAQVGLTRPADIGADVCHLNLHKTFCIPHGGGGPGMGPIGVASHLQRFLPGHPVIPTGGEDAIGAVSAAPWGSASILLISWAYMMLMGPEGLTEATRMAILNANYIAARLSEHYPVFYRGRQGRVAHECILDMRHFKKSAGIEVDDVAKRLMDYGFHAPTMSFPIAGTMMVEPTESESLSEIDRFCDAMIAIRQEIQAIEEGAVSRDDNALKNAPHTAQMVASSGWSHTYSRESAAFPTRHTRERKFWPPVGRLNNVQGDRRLVCVCPPIEDYSK